LYVDNQIGAAGATGLGENVMRFCGSFLVVEFMRNGAEPTEACRLAIQRISEVAEMPIEKLDVNFIALSKTGKWGSAGTTRGFEYAVGLPSGTQVLAALPLSDKLIGPEGGNRR
jgi:isoaspartyl peptidase/L-asparaginase-like protein (Ntn-hydrolase superfamily)